VIEETASAGDRLSDAVAHFGGSWSFISTCLVILVLYTSLNFWLGRGAWDPLSFHFAEFVCFDAGGIAGTHHHDEPKPAGPERFGCAASWAMR